MDIEVEKLILDSLKELIELKWIDELKEETKNKLVYPTKRNKERRVSEQESRFLFIKKLEAESNYLYSVEAPTNEEYYFTGKEENKRSGNFDVCLYDEDKKRKHLLEFKALNPKKQSYEKDFEKLMKDENGLTNYFIQVIININNGTLTNIENKYKDAVEYSKKSKLKNQSQLVIFLCVIGNDKKILKYQVLDNSLTKPNLLYPA